MALALDTIVELFRTRGEAWYGDEPVSQLAHALQCAQLAENAGASACLVAASLLHDLGHLLAPADDSAARLTDGAHEHVAAAALRKLFPVAVVEPVRLHVTAKRYLCAIDPDYRARLTPASRRSLELQGGLFDARQAAAFISEPFALDAVRLRRWDDQAKRPAKRTSSLAHFVHALRSSAC